MKPVHLSYRVPLLKLSDQVFFLKQNFVKMFQQWKLREALNIKFDLIL